ncbi:uncharacterized protein LOC133324436 [Musca vetustissima]|uniref:uncharacterized protein LOC133324436 n=1 Tax=Musca vetustissima TaxID=27455 RepID=UPI002AB6BA06|nr:uncharacterized protein LOC133324436 [Musca vetustissima]
MEFLFNLLLVIASASAGIIRHDTAHGSTAYSHQTISHGLGVDDSKLRIVTPMHHVSPLESSSKPTASKILFPPAKDAHLMDNFSASNQPISADPTISYKGETPVVNSPVHTPAHLAFSARPIMFQMLPKIIPAPYISYKDFKANPSYHKVDNF